MCKQLNICKDREDVTRKEKKRERKTHWNQGIGINLLHGQQYLKVSLHEQIHLELGCDHDRLQELVQRQFLDHGGEQGSTLGEMGEYLLRKSSITVRHRKINGIGRTYLLPELIISLQLDEEMIIEIVMNCFEFFFIFREEHRGSFVGDELVGGNNFVGKILLKEDETLLDLRQMLFLRTTKKMNDEITSKK